MANVKFFQKYMKVKRQGQEVKIFGTNRKVLPQVIRMCNMKALSLLVQKLWPRLSFFKSRSKDEVTRSKILVPTEWSCHK